MTSPALNGSPVAADSAPSSCTQEYRSHESLLTFSPLTPHPLTLHLHSVQPQFVAVGRKLERVIGRPERLHPSQSHIRGY